jgi:hypothetical protein
MSGDRNINMGSGNYIENVNGDYIQGEQYNNYGVNDAVQEVQAILAELQDPDLPDSQAGRMMLAARVVNFIEQKSGLQQKLVGALRGGSLKAFEKALDNPAGAFIVGAIEGWINEKK